MTKFLSSIRIAVALVAAVAVTLVTGCATNPNIKTPHVYQAAGKVMKFGAVQDPITGQYSLGYQSGFLGGMIVPVDVVLGTNGQVSFYVPDAVMSYELGGKGTFFGSGNSTVTFAVGPNAVASILGAQHYPINESYWTNSATGLSTTLPINGTVQPVATTTTGTNSTQKLNVIVP